jgi:hypothetical protein
MAITTEGLRRLGTVAVADVVAALDGVDEARWWAEDFRQRRSPDVYELDNRAPHAAANRGATPRLHLISDWLVDGDDVRTT